MIRVQVARQSVVQEPTDYIVIGRHQNDVVPVGAALPFIKDYLETSARYETANPA